MQRMYLGTKLRKWQYNLKLHLYKIAFVLIIPYWDIEGNEQWALTYYQFGWLILVSTSHSNSTTWIISSPVILVTLLDITCRGFTYIEYSFSIIITYISTVFLYSVRKNCSSFLFKFYKICLDDIRLILW